MRKVWTFLVILTGLVLFLRHKFQMLSPEEKKGAFNKLVNGIFVWAENMKLFRRSPAFQYNYDDDYPHLKRLEDNYETIRDECLALLGYKEQLTDVEVLGGMYTAGGIHAIQWKSFVFKSGQFIEENCALCPQTAALIKQIPDVHTAFFSILDPQQYIKPHWGYYKGFLRYHLGILIPNNNEDQACFLRVNDDPADNLTRDLSLIANGVKYYWKNGEGVIFDDTFLHDAANNSDQVRVVLWLDMQRKLPLPLRLLSSLILQIARYDPLVKQINENAVVMVDKRTASGDTTATSKSP